MATLDIEYGKAILKQLEEEGSSSEATQDTNLQLEMILQNSSYGHEYARIELEEVESFFKQDELIEKMESCKRAYFIARRSLQRKNPERLREIEAKLVDQKVQLFSGYTA